MKNTYLSTLVGFSLSLSAFAEPPQAKLTASGWYQRGMSAIKAGDPEVAKTAFQNALKLQPGFAPAKYQLGRIPELNARAKIAKRKALFDATIIKEINFNDASFAEALNALNALATEASDKKFTPNFFVQDPAKKLADRKVTLKMNNIPLSAALSYILEGAGATARYDEFATVIRPSSK